MNTQPMNILSATLEQVCGWVLVRVYGLVPVPVGVSAACMTEGGMKHGCQR